MPLPSTALFYFEYNPGKTAVLTVLPLLSALCYTAKLSSDRVRTLGTHFALMKMTEADPCDSIYGSTAKICVEIGSDYCHKLLLCTAVIGGITITFLLLFIFNPVQTSKIILDNSRDEVSLLEQYTIENVS